MPVSAKIPEVPPTNPLNLTNPVTPFAIVKEAPVPEPKPDTAPLTVVVPAPVPAAIVKFCEPPVSAFKEIAPPLEFKLTGPPDIVVVPLTVKPS